MCIFVNINFSYNESGIDYTELFNMQGLMRMRLTPDCSKLVMCTTGGYIILINDLSLENLAQDLHGFKVILIKYFNTFAS